MFLDVLRRRNPRLIEQAIALHQAGQHPGELLCHRPRRGRSECPGDRAPRPTRHGLKVFAMTKQMGRNGDFCRAVVRGGIGEVVASTWNAPAPRTAPAWRSAISAISCRSRGPRRTPRHRFAPGLLDGVQRGEGGGSRRGGDRSAGAGRIPGAHPGRGRPLLSRPRGRLRGRRCRRGRRPPRRDSTARASPASPPFPRCSSIRRRGKIAPTPNLETLAPRRRGAGEGGSAGHRDQRAGHDLVRGPRGARGGRRDAGRAGPRPDRHDPAARASRTCPNCPAVVYVSEVSHLHRRRRLLLRRRALYRSGLPRLPGEGDRVARADQRRSRAPHRRDPAACGDRLLRHDRRTSGPRGRGRRHRRVRLPAAGLRHPRLHRRQCRASPAARPSLAPIHDALGRPVDWPI